MTTEVDDLRVKDYHRQRTRFWPAGEEFYMDTQGKLHIAPAGLLQLGSMLTHLEWAVEGNVTPADLAARVGHLASFWNIVGFEDIGQEAADSQASMAILTVLTRQDKYDFRKLVTRWHTVAQERCSALFLITPTTILNPKELVDGIQGVAVPETLKLLEDQERGDLDEACRCILVGSPTAGEFMALRAIESLLRRWYVKNDNTKTEQVENKPWGFVIDLLSKEYEDKKAPPSLAVLGNLKLLRDEVAHPDKVSSLTDAESTLLIACSLTPRLMLPSVPVSLTP